MTGRHGGVRVKICGCRTPADVRAAAEAGASYVGLVFADSPRRVTIDEARAVADAGRAMEALEQAAADAAGGRVAPVGVFVDAGPEDVARTAGEVGLAIAQLHGSEPPEACRALRAMGLGVWKAVRPRGREELAAEIRRYAGSVDGLLVEGHSEEAAGGTGTGFPHGWLDGWDEVVAAGRAASAAGSGTASGDAPDAAPPPLLVLSGGLTPETVARAVRRVRPDVVDVSSGVEREPGMKDPALVRRFAERALAAASPQQSAGRP